MTFIPRIMAVTLAAALSSEILAAAPSGSVEGDFFTEFPIVLSVSRLEQPTRDAPATVNVITSEEIRSSGARDLADVLRLFPGFQVADTILGAPVAVYHGLASDQAGRMQILVDGRSQYSPLWFGGNNWTTFQVPLSDIERIEIIRGSNSAAYGANAVLGVINIRTVSARANRGNAVEFSGGDNGILRAFVAHNINEEAAAFRFVAEKYQTEGLQRFPDDRDITRMSFKSEIKLSSQDEVVASLGGVRAKHGIGYDPATGPGKWIGDEPPHLRKINNYFGQLEWTHGFSWGAELKARYFRMLETGREKYLGVFDEIPAETATTPTGDLVGDLAANYDYDPQVSRDDFELQLTLPTSDSGRIVGGVGYRQDDVHDRQLYVQNPDQRIYLGRVFLLGEWHAGPTLVLSAGSTYESDSIAGSSFAPRVGANWKMDKHHMLRASVSRAYRSPSIFEQRADVQVIDITNTLPIPYQETLAINKLRHEKLKAVDVGYLGDWPSIGMKVDARVFSEELDDVVVYYKDTTPPILPIARVPANGQNVTMRGGELQLLWSPSVGSKLWVNYTNINIRAEMLTPPVGESGWAPWKDYAEASAPQEQVGLHWWQGFPAGFKMQTSWYQVGQYRWTKNGNAPSHKRLDWRLAYPFKNETLNGEVAITVRAAYYRDAEFRYNGAATQTYNKQIVDPETFLTFRIAY